MRSVRGRNSPSQIAGLSVDDKILTDPTDIANQLGVFSSNSDDNHYDPEFLIQKIRNESFELDLTGDDNHPLNLPFTMKELEYTISNVHGSTPGPDDIHYTMIKNLTPPLNQCLLRLYNRILCERSFPSSWGEAEVIPVLKKRKDKMCGKSYRPISLTSCLMQGDREWFIEKNNLVIKQQSGCRKGHSCWDHIAILETEIQEAFRKRKYLVATFLDLEKAFNTTWRRGILKTIYEWGVRGRILNFISNFMNKRTFKVQIGNHYAIVKFLGVSFDRRLKWLPYIRELKYSC